MLHPFAAFTYTPKYPDRDSKSDLYTNLSITNSLEYNKYACDKDRATGAFKNFLCVLNVVGLDMF